MFPIKPKDLSYPFDGLMGLVGPFVGFGTFALGFVPNKSKDLHYPFDGLKGLVGPFIVEPSHY